MSCTMFTVQVVNHETVYSGAAENTSMFYECALWLVFVVVCGVETVLRGNPCVASYFKGGVES